MRPRMWDVIEAGGIAVGTYATLVDVEIVKMFAAADLDFIRFDPHNIDYRGHLPTLVETAKECDLAVWLRVDNDADAVTAGAKIGADVLTIPDVRSATQVEAAINALYPELQDGSISLGCQIETLEGLATRDAIVALEGLSVVHSGRNDLSVAFGLRGDPFHPRVLDAERQIVDAALAAGKHVSLHHPLSEDGIRRAREWARKGVGFFSFDTDAQLLSRDLKEISTALGESLTG